MYLVSGESLCLDWDLAWAVKGACDWTLGQAGAQGTEYCNTCEYGRYVCVVCLGTCLGLLEPFVNKCVYIYIYFMTTTISCAVLPHFTTQSSRHIPKQRGVTVRSPTGPLSRDVAFV